MCNQVKHEHEFYCLLLRQYFTSKLRKKCQKYLTKIIEIALIKNVLIDVVEALDVMALVDGELDEKEVDSVDSLADDANVEDSVFSEVPVVEDSCFVDVSVVIVESCAVVEF